jgi:hypothetical protein
MFSRLLTAFFAIIKYWPDLHDILAIRHARATQTGSIMLDELQRQLDADGVDMSGNE